MDITLICTGHVAYHMAVDRYAAGLSPQGLAQSQRVARLCREWGVQLLVAGTMVSAEQTADAVHALIPDAARWDLDELQGIGIEEQAMNPMMHPHREHWTDDQRVLAYERTWARVTAALARIEVYCGTYGLEHVAIISHEGVLNMILLSWLGLDWRSADTVRFDLDGCATVRATLGDGPARIAWVNRPS